MKCRELTAILEKIAPLQCACDWDNVGLLAGRSGKNIKKVYIALDATDDVIEEAIRWGADLLLTHHPLIFKPLKKVNDEDFIARRVLKLIQNDLCYYAMHTNFDCAPGCMADAAADRLGLMGLGVLEEEGRLYRESCSGGSCGQEEVPYGIGKTGYLRKEMTVRELALLVKEQFGLPFVTIYGENAIDKKVRFIAISPGSGKSLLRPAMEAGVQVLITGDMGHHEGLDAAAEGMALIDAGHYGLEYLFQDFMENYLKEKTGSCLEIRKALVQFPAKLV